MPLILAIEADHRVAQEIKDVIGRRVHAEVLVAATTEQALEAIGTRVPDLVLVPPLFSPRDEASLTAALRGNTAAGRVQMLTMPAQTAAGSRATPRGLLSKLRRDKTSEAPYNSDFSLSDFADQIASYLKHQLDERAKQQAERGLAADLAAPAESPNLKAAPRAEDPAPAGRDPKVELPFEPNESVPYEPDSLPPSDPDGANSWLDAFLSDPPADASTASASPEIAQPALTPAARRASASAAVEEEWAHVDAAHSSFAVLFAKLHDVTMPARND